MAVEADLFDRGATLLALNFYEQDAPLRKAQAQVRSPATKTGDGIRCPPALCATSLVRDGEADGVRKDSSDKVDNLLLDVGFEASGESHL